MNICLDNRFCIHTSVNDISTSAAVTTTGANRTNTSHNTICSTNSNINYNSSESNSNNVCLSYWISVREIHSILG